MDGNTSQNHNVLPQSPKINVLIVGAGGLGCELVKNFSKPFKEIDLSISIMDYDTISESNLNRQFCYGRNNVGRQKVVVLKEYFEKINPFFHLQAYHTNLLDCSLSFFTPFNVLISALDNSEARDFLNRISIRANIPMIDAGTSGYNGQIQIHSRYETQCRLCRPQIWQAQQSAAVCTLRGKPSRNNHCIQFAMEIFKDIFGGENKRTFGEVLKRQGIEQAIELHNYLFEEGLDCKNIPEIQLHRFPPSITVPTDIKLSEEEYSIEELSTPWDKDLHSQIFVQSYHEIKKKLTMQNGIIYDKDEFVHVLFLNSLVNLRIYNFQNLPHSKLKPMSFFQVKDSSGKIVPAIASTNAIAAALEVTALLKIIKYCIKEKKENSKIKLSLGDKYQCSYATIRGSLPSSYYKIESMIPQKPKYNCMECCKACFYVQLSCNFDLVSLGSLQQYLSKMYPMGQFEMRDMRCKQYVVVQNLRKKRTNNLGKLLNYNHKLLDYGLKIDNQQQAQGNSITIKYVPDPISDTKWEFFIQNSHIQHSQIHLLSTPTPQQIDHMLQSYQQEKASALQQEALNHSTQIFEQFGQDCDDLGQQSANYP